MWKILTQRSAVSEEDVMLTTYAPKHQVAMLKVKSEKRVFTLLLFPLFHTKTARSRHVNPVRSVVIGYQ